MTISDRKYQCICEVEVKVKLVHIWCHKSRKLDCSGTDRQTGASIQPRPQPMPAHTDFGHCSHAATRSSSLQYNGLHPIICAITWITTRLLMPEGWKAELA